MCGCNIKSIFIHINGVDKILETPYNSIQFNTISSYSLQNVKTKLNHHFFTFMMVGFIAGLLDFTALASASCI